MRGAEGGVRGEAEAANDDNGCEAPAWVTEQSCSVAEDEYEAWSVEAGTTTTDDEGDPTAAVAAVEIEAEVDQGVDGFGEREDVACVGV